MGKLTAAALKRKKPVQDELLIPADDDQRERFENAKEFIKSAGRLLDMANLADDAEQIVLAEAKLKAAKDDLETVREEIRRKGTSIVLIGVGRERWEQILRENPASPEQAAEDEKKAADDPNYRKRTFNPDTFWPAIVADSADSDLTAEDWRKLVFDCPDWGPAEIAELRERTTAVNQGSRILELGN